jgi:oligopeptide/dipeptide ABC transporter ATP-binding protein
MGVPVVNTDDVAIRNEMRPITRTLLSVRNLTVCYRMHGREFRAISDLSFDIAPGQIVGVLGESGCGKTTAALSLLRVLPETARVASGSVFFAGKDLLLLRESELRRIRGAQIAIVHQDASVLNPVMRVGDQVSEVLCAHQRCGRLRAREQVRAVFSAIGLRECERIYDAYPHQLSGGQRQRIAIAQALICKPQLIIADEPTASVDPETAAAILSLMAQLRTLSGTSFLVISHDPAALAAISDKVIVMYAGEIIEEGSLTDVYAEPSHPYAHALLQCRPSIPPMDKVPSSRRLPFIPGNPPNPLENTTGCSFARRCADRMEVCDFQKPQQTRTSASRLVRCLKYEVQSRA